MKSNYKKLGCFIRESDIRNNDGLLGEENLYGISVSKEFIVSHANLVGVSFENYKVVAPRQFAYIPDTSRRGDKIAISLNRLDEEIIVSSICSVFEIIDENELLPEYLMLWFMRSEFDRYARFMSNGSAREVFDWDCMCGVDIPVPSIDEQRKIVHDYQVISSRIELLREINANLSAQAQSIFVSYMQKYEYTLQPLSSIADIIDCLHTEKPKQIENGIYQLIQLDNIRDDGFLDLKAYKYMISKSDYENWTRKCEINEGDCVITNVGRMGAVSQAPRGTHAAMGRNMTCIRLKQSIDLPAYLIILLLSQHMKLQIQDKKDVGTIMEALNVKNIPKLLCPVFDDRIMLNLENELKPIVNHNELRNKECQTLIEMKRLLLNKLSVCCVSECSLEKGLIALLKQQQPDYLFIAGDLTSVASPQEFIFCEKKILELADEIALDHSHILCCMGNHDIDRRIVELWKSDTKITEECEQLRKDRYQHIASVVSSICLDEIKEYCDNKGEYPFTGVYEAKDFVLFALNTSWLCGPNQDYPHGKLSEKQFAWFKDTIKKYVNDDRKRIVLMHHHPFNYPYPTVGEDISSIAEGADFVEAAEVNKVDLVVHGHRHHPKVKTRMSEVGYPVTYLCAGSLSVNAKQRSNGEIPNTIHFIEVDKNNDYLCFVFRTC